MRGIEAAANQQGGDRRAVVGGGRPFAGWQEGSLMQLAPSQHRRGG
jgi:hypothetical protein